MIGRRYLLFLNFFVYSFFYVFLPLEDWKYKHNKKFRLRIKYQLNKQIIVLKIFIYFNKKRDKERNIRTYIFFIILLNFKFMTKISNFF